MILLSHALLIQLGPQTVRVKPAHFAAMTLIGVIVYEEPGEASSFVPIHPVCVRNHMNRRKKHL
jgi:hypothetical protein